MKKTISINLNGIQFIVDEDAYNRLDKYLSSLKKHFSDFEDSSEIVEDIEGRIAEIFSEKIQGIKKVINLSEVEEVISAMGEANQFEEENENNGPSKKNSNKPNTDKKLMRDKDNQKVAGVAAGLAAYFGTDPLLFRLLFAVPLVLGIADFPGGEALSNLSITIYILLWMLLPEAKTITDKMAMRGEPITIDQIEKTVKNKWTGTNIAKVVDENLLGKSTNVTNKPIQSIKPVKSKNFFESVSLTIGGVIRFMGPLIVKAFGFCITVTAVLIFSVIIGAYIFSIINTGYIFDYFELGSVFKPIEFYLLATGGLIVAGVPLILLSTLGESITAMQNKFKAGVFYGLITVWIITISALVSSSLYFYNKAEVLIEEYNSNINQTMTNSEIKIKSFSRLTASGGIKINHIDSEENKIILKGAQRDIDTVDISQSEDSLNIDLNNRMLKDWISLFRKRGGIEIDIYSPSKSFESIDLNGATDMNFDQIEVDSLELWLNGASKLTGEVISKDLKVDSNGASIIRLNGSATTISLTLNGASKAILQTLQTQNAIIELNGASNAEMSISESVSGFITGAGMLEITGNPKNTVEIDGVNNIKFN